VVLAEGKEGKRGGDIDNSYGNWKVQERSKFG
jgi:hypothetical protein